MSKVKNMKEELIGVIVPVYKVEKYIAECIESILAQTYTNFRLILVDDGTPDNAGIICDEYAKKDPRITVIHQENAGVTRARARGVEEASDCEFITFVDGDDTLLPHSLQYLLLHLIKYDSDIVISPADKYVPQNKELLSADEYLVLLLRDISLCNSPWGKLIKTGLFNKNTFDIPKSIIIGEDLLMNINLVLANKKQVVIVPQNTYNYRIHSESAMRTYKRTPEYEAIFYNQLRKIVPFNKWNKFKVYTIEARLSRFRQFSAYKYQVKDLFQSEFYKNLRKDVVETKYRITGLDKILFYYDNIILRFISINLKKCKNLIDRCL